MHEGERQGDNDAGDIAMFLACGDIEDYIDKDESQDDFDEDCADHADACCAEGLVAVFAEMLGAKPRRAEDCIEQAGASKSARDLGNYVADEIFDTEFAVDEHGERDGWVDVAA